MNLNALYTSERENDSSIFVKLTEPLFACTVYTSIGENNFYVYVFRLFVFGIYLFNG